MKYASFKKMKSERENIFHNKHEPNIREFKSKLQSQRAERGKNKFPKQYNVCEPIL